LQLTKRTAYGAALQRHYAEGLLAERLADRHERMVLDTTALVDELPPMRADLLRRLLCSGTRRDPPAVWLPQVSQIPPRNHSWCLGCLPV
jgi:hypothetical protein